MDASNDGDAAADVSLGEDNERESEPGDLEDHFKDDRNVPPQERRQHLMTLCFSSIEGFTTDVLPCCHKLFEKQKKKHKPSITLLKKEIKRRKPDFKGLSNKKVDDLIAILKGDDMKLDDVDQRFVSRMEKEVKASLQQATDESMSASASSSKSVSISVDDRHRFVEAMLCDDAKDKLTSSQECLSREQLDARNSVMNVLGCFETVAETFNDPSFTPHLVAAPSLHPELAESRPLPQTCFGKQLPFAIEHHDP